MLQLRRWQRRYSYLGHYLKASWCGQRGKCRSFSVHPGRDDRSFWIVAVAERHVSRKCGSGFFHDKDQVVGITLKILWFLLWKECMRSPIGWPSFGRDKLKKSCMQMDGNKSRHGNVFACARRSDYHYRSTWTTSKRLGCSMQDPRGERCRKIWILKI